MIKFSEISLQNVEKHLTIKERKRIMKKVEKRELNKKLRTKGANS